MDSKQELIKTIKILLLAEDMSLDFLNFLESKEDVCRVSHHSDCSIQGTMSTEGKMTIDERRKYLRTMKRRYVKADRKEPGRLLDEMEAIGRRNDPYPIWLSMVEWSRR